MPLLPTRRWPVPARACALLAALALTFGALAATASAAGPNAIVDLPGCTANTLAANDDGSTAPVPMGFTASFFGTSYTELYVNNNGNVTFDAELGQYTPFDFSTAGNVIIAPFLADVDTRAGALVTYGQTTFDGQPAFCVNWRDVGYYREHVDKLNSFQLLLVKRGSAGAFDIVFNYDQIQWETGDASNGEGGFGGTPAAWGFANGDGDAAHYFVGPGSFTSRALVDGGPSALVASSRGTTQLGRYIFAVSAAGPTGPRLSGEVTSGGTPVALAPVQICPTGGGACVTRTTNSSGRYQAYGLSGSHELTAFPPADSSRTPGRAGPVTIGSTDVVQDIALGPSPDAPPPGTSISNTGTTDDGIPIASWNDTLTLTTQGCSGGTASYELRMRGVLKRSGPMTEGPAGTYTATIAPLAPDTGDGAVHIAIACPNPADATAIDFGIYIDPSGWVRDSLGAPISGATVVLLRSGTPTGTFTPVPDGSAVMSPSNRTNPDLTDAEGHFGWDVVAGYYKVHASKEGCVSNADRSVSVAESRVMTIPPPVMDLDLRLFCGEVAPPAGGGGTGGPPPPPPGPPPAGGPAPDRTAPVVTGLKLAPRTFRASAVLTAVAAKAKPKKAAPSGSTIRFGLSERASVVLRIVRRTTGRRVGSSCRRQTKSNAKRKRCTRWVTAGTLRRADLPAGANSIAFSGRIGRRKLSVGSYRLEAVATDAAANAGARRSATFRIVRR